MNTVIVYWSGTGNTEAMAKAIAEGIKSKNGEVDVFSVSDVDSSIIEKYGKFAFGCPSMGAEVLEESEFEPFFTSIEGMLDGKKVALFGSYGWGDGEWMRDWCSRVRDIGADLYDVGFIQKESPDEAACEAFGAGFAGF